MLQKKQPALKELDFLLNSFLLPDGMIAQTRTTTYTYNPYILPTTFHVSSQ